MARYYQMNVARSKDIPGADRLSSHFFVCAFLTLTNLIHPLFAQSL